jgi:hypothetical protein
MRTTKLILIIWLSTLFLVGCSDGGSSFSLLSDSDSFQQTSGTVNSKVDILWVIDNSGSMDSSQSNLTSNFSSFISAFAAKDLDYKMAFTTTDAYRGLPGQLNRPACLEFRDRVLDNNCNNVSGYSASGYKILTPASPGASLINSVFSQNATVGIWGSGNERGMQSMHAALTANVNVAYNFLRDDAFLAVIMVSDEVDSSTAAPSYTGSTVESYVNFLDDITDSTGPLRQYSVNAITILDNACLSQLNSTFIGRTIGTQYISLANLTDGISTSLCGNFATDLERIADGILSLATQFYLSRIPIEATIAVRINGAVVPNKATNPMANGGWEYIAASNSIKFSGAYIPPKDATVNVDYDPVAYGQ